MIVFTSNPPEWFFTKGGPAPVFYYIGFIVFGATVLCLRAIKKEALISELSWQASRFIWFWLSIWIVWTIFNYFGSTQSEIATDRLFQRLEMALVLAAFLFLNATAATPQAMGNAMIFVTLLGVAVNFIDFVNPIFTRVPGRSAGMYLNPTISGFILTLSATVAVLFVPRRLRWAFLALTAIGVFLTFARAAWILLFVSIIILFWQGHLGFYRQRVVLGLTAVLGVMAFGYAISSGWLAHFLVSSQFAQYFDDNTLARLGMVEFATDFSARERELVLFYGWEKYLEVGNPYLGYGLAFTHEWDFRVGTHNMYLMHLIEGGVIGLALYLGLIIWMIISRQGIARLMAVNLAIYSLFSHNILDSPGRVFFIALIAGTLLTAFPQDRQYDA